MTRTAFVIPVDLDAPPRVFVWDEPGELVALLHAELGAEHLHESRSLATPFGAVTMWTDADGPSRPLPTNSRAAAVSYASGGPVRILGPAVITGTRRAGGDFRGLPRAGLLEMFGAMDDFAREHRVAELADRIAEAIDRRDRALVASLIETMFRVSDPAGWAAVVALAVTNPTLVPDRYLDGP